jgi:glycosyltransferase involved in cell wall biosynthesis
MLREGTNSKIKVLHVIRSIDPTTGGPAFAVMQMAKALSEGGISVDIATTTYPENDKEGALAAVPLVQDGTRCFSFPRQVDSTWSFSWELWSWLKKNVKNYDVVHTTGVFTFPVLIAALEAKKTGVPYIIRPAGTLDVYPLAQKAWRKKLYYRVILKRIIDGACAIHVTSEPERDQLSLLGVREKCAVIPLAVEIPRLIRTWESPEAQLVCAEQYVLKC